jgi:hypothetical protein
MKISFLFYIKNWLHPEEILLMGQQFQREREHLKQEFATLYAFIYLGKL